MNPSPVVVVSRRIFPTLIDEMRTRYTVIDNQADASWSAEQLAAHLADAELRRGRHVRGVEAVGVAVVRVPAGRAVRRSF